MISFCIKFDKPNKKYKSNQIVHCKVRIDIHTKFRARSLCLRFLGIAHTKWTKSKTVNSSGHSRIVNERFSGDEQYFKQYIYFLGEQNGMKNKNSVLKCLTINLY